VLAGALLVMVVLMSFVFVGSGLENGLLLFKLFGDSPPLRDTAKVSNCGSDE
jgi:hypothetical protein